MIHRERQQGNQEIALGKAHALQLPRQRRSRAVEFAPGNNAITLRADDGSSLRPRLRPLRNHVMQ